MGAASRTHRRVAVCRVLVVALFAISVLAAAPRVTASSSPTLRWAVTKTASGGSTYTMAATAYSLTLPRGSDLLTIRRAAGGGSFQLPLAALIGRSTWPSGMRLRASTSEASLVLVVSTASRRPFLEATVTAEPLFFTIGFSGQLGPSPALEPAFFSTGKAGLAMASVTSGFTPDPRFTPLTRTPTVQLGPIPVAPYTAPFSPPPFDVELATPVGWLGLGLVQVPNATEMVVSSQGQLTVNYPLAVLAHISDLGAGGRVGDPRVSGDLKATGSWLRFPAFTVTLAANWLTGLSSYHLALTSLGQAPVAAPPGRRPAWWSWPLVDTWGQQLVTGAARKNDDFTASWVLHYVALWRQKFHLQHFTVIIDAQWQTTLGSATPSSRFGGAAGMRRLVDELHAQGLKVLLWWPLWAVPQGPLGKVKSDPTSSAFATTLAKQMSSLLGSGSGGLHVDGLKLDWGSLIPQVASYSRPQLGIGAAALLRYMRLLAHDAWRVQGGAVIDASAMAPQFGGYEDLLRLYDASSADAWTNRAAIVSAVDPLSLIDGDGWRLTSAQAVPHIVESAIFGTPALYYATSWGGGAPISNSEASALGLLLGITQNRGQGTAWPLAGDNDSPLESLTGDDWTYTVGGRLVAETLDSAQAAVVYHYAAGCAAPSSARIVSTVGVGLLIPLPGDAMLVSVSPTVSAAEVAGIGGPEVAITVEPGITYTLTVRGC
ncbi:MAG: hypothetical protein ACYDC5_13975 [Candidatus Dormibacteria bacterium]